MDIKIARNTVYDYLRKTKWTAFFNTSDNNNQALSSISIEEKIVHKEQVEKLYTSLKKLKRDYQEVIILRKINELSIKETAEILGWSEDKVKAKLARALKKLKAEMTVIEGGFHESIKRV